MTDVDWLVWDMAASLWPFCDAADWRRGITEFVAGYRRRRQSGW